MSSVVAMPKGIAQLEILTLNSEVQKLDKTDIFVWLTSQGVPVSVTTRLDEIWDFTKTIAGQVIHIGKIIALKIIEFCKKHPHTAIGMLLGAAIGALVNLIPFIGPFLAPLTTAIGLAYGGMVGARLDNPTANTPFEGLIKLAKDFFQMLAEIFIALKVELFG